MVTIIENWTEVVGIVVALLPSPTRDGFLEMELNVEEVRPVADFPNLVQARPGENITVLIRTSQVADSRPKAGTEVDLRLRAAGPPLVYFADADWSGKEE